MDQRCPKICYQKKEDGLTVTACYRYATRAYQTSHDIYAVAALLGHKSVETTQVYAQLDDTHLRDVAMRAQLEIPPQ